MPSGVDYPNVGRCIEWESAHAGLLYCHRTMTNDAEGRADMAGLICVTTAHHPISHGLQDGRRESDGDELGRFLLEATQW